jgi:hypothetical protein
MLVYLLKSPDFCVLYNEGDRHIKTRWRILLGQTWTKICGYCITVDCLPVIQ